jgi:hypothetical protein
VTEKWGNKIVERLAHDLQAEFSGVEGFSPRNLRYMRFLTEVCPEREILQHLIANCPGATISGFWTGLRTVPHESGTSGPFSNSAEVRIVLVLQIKSRLHEREGKTLTNFQRALPPPESDFAEQISAFEATLVP